MSDSASAPRTAVGGSGFTLRPAMPGDVPEIARIEQTIFSDPWSDDVFFMEIDSSIGRLMVAAEGEKIVGYSASMFAADEAELTNLAVASDARRKGVARRLLVDVIEEGRRRGARNLYLEVRVSNAAAIALYSGHGFRELGRRRRYYSGPVEDAIMMALDLR